MQSTSSFGQSGTMVAQMKHSESVLVGLGHTKVCPRCGQTLFADMDICYGCMYDFSRDHRVKTLPPPELGVSGQLCPRKTQAATDLDEPTGLVRSVPLSTQQGSAGNTAEAPAYRENVLARGLPVRESATETTGKLPRIPTEPQVGEGVSVLLRTGDVDVLVPVPAGGLSVGRAPTNDIVLHSRAVSREHALLKPADGGLLVCDLGSTNPPLLQGKPIEDAATIPFGERLSLCGSYLEPVHANL